MARCDTTIGSVRRDLQPSHPRLIAAVAFQHTTQSRWRAIHPIFVATNLAATTVTSL
jgi:hypothetical protein